MRTRLAVFLTLGIGLVFGLLVARGMLSRRGRVSDAAASGRRLRLLTYSSFVGISGPGRDILRRFETENDCTVEVVTSGDAGLLLERLKLGDAPFDVVLGLDTPLLEPARAGFKWRRLDIDKTNWFPEPAAAGGDDFTAFDWSPLSFVYRDEGDGKTPAPPARFDDLTRPEFKRAFALQDPHASSPGLQFFHWVKALKGAETGAWLRRFKPNVNSVSPTWSFSYGLFKKHQARFVFSYLTSLAFHWGDENDRSYRILAFPEGHPVQVELAAIPADCAACGLAEAFVRALHQDWAQTLIMRKNYMFPVVKGLESGTVFAELPALKTLATADGKNLSEWDEVFPR
jgi:thiamine transport system substrate-binding protein